MTPPLHNREAVQLRPLSKGIGRPTVEANLSGEEHATHALNGLVDVVGALGEHMSLTYCLAGQARMTSPLG